MADLETRRSERIAELQVLVLLVLLTGAESSCCVYWCVDVGAGFGGNNFLDVGYDAAVRADAVIGAIVVGGVGGDDDNDVGDDVGAGSVSSAAAS
eukprot:511261-Hanusia_phi.AAC.1